ncbi:hypothetical protein QEH52_17010 [Coraliomargarita sp. SDUM461003]|uniref:Septum formation inhibitor Maf n=2 Tax=Thalassobacterium maritimum TaxID=3041265 RepID=A0ABU1B0X2_9BACT|nr:hypothetical protein [Coraliomargarita sp. SDUM461003]
MRLFYYCLTFTLTASLSANQVREFWFNGAEINRYELTQTRYGESHPGHVEFIYVTEPFLTDVQVKNESGGQPSTDVLKLNALRTFNTGIYSYRTMSSTFQPIDLEKYPRALKTNTSVQDWCGQSFSQLNRTAQGWRGELRSYFQSEADQNFELRDALLEDAVWLKLRLSPQSLPTGPIQIIPSGVHTRFAHSPVHIERATAERITQGAMSRYIIRYENIDRELHINYETKFPHIIQSWKEIEDGKRITQAVLTHRVMNSNYWSEHAPQDASKRKTLGLNPIAN